MCVRFGVLFVCLSVETKTINRGEENKNKNNTEKGKTKGKRKRTNSGSSVSTLASNAGIHEGAKWQFCRQTQLPLSIATEMASSALSPWPIPSEMLVSFDEKPFFYFKKLFKSWSLSIWFPFLLIVIIY